MPLDKAQVVALRTKLQSALDAAADAGESIKVGNATYDPNGSVTFKVTVVVAGGLTREESNYDRMRTILGLPERGASCVIRGTTYTTVGLNSAGTKVIIKKGLTKYSAPIDSVLMGAR